MYHIEEKKDIIDYHSGSYHVVACTGHRPGKAPVLKSSSVAKVILVSEIEAYVLSILTVEPEKRVIMMNGLGLGFDMLMALISLRMRLPLHLIIPFENHFFKWDYTDQQLARSIISKADSVVYTSKTYYEGAYKVRNRYMVDRCTELIALYDKDRQSNSGTGQTVRMAEKQFKEVVNFWNCWVAKEN